MVGLTWGGVGETQRTMLSWALGGYKSPPNQEEGPKGKVVKCQPRGTVRLPAVAQEGA